MSLPRRSLLAVVLLAVVLTLLWATHPHLLRAMAIWLDVGGRPQPAQYVMVLTGDEETRALLAGVLVKAGFARGVLVTRNRDHAAGNRVGAPAVPTKSTARCWSNAAFRPATSRSFRPRRRRPTTRRKPWPPFSETGPRPRCWSSPTTSTRDAAVGCLPECWAGGPRKSPLSPPPATTSEETAGGKMKREWWRL